MAYHSLGKLCFNALKDAAEKNSFNEEDCLVFAKKISDGIGGHVQRDIKSNGYSRRTIERMLDEWHKTYPEEISVDRVLEILRSEDLKHNALALTIEQGSTVSVNHLAKKAGKTSGPTSTSNTTTESSKLEKSGIQSHNTTGNVGGSSSGSTNITVIGNPTFGNITNTNNQQTSDNDKTLPTLLDLVTDETIIENITKKLKSITSIPTKTNDEKRSESILRKKPVLIKNLMQSVCLVKGPKGGTAFLAAVDGGVALLSAGHVFPPKDLENQIRHYTLYFNAISGVSKDAECVKVPLEELIQIEHIIISCFNGKKNTFGTKKAAPVYSKVKDPKMDFFALWLNKDGKKLLKKKGLKFLRTASRILKKREAIFYIGYPELGDGTRSLVISHGNIKKPLEKNIVSHDLDTEPGASGSPIFGEDYEVVAVHVRGKEEHGKTNEGQKINAVVQALNAAKEVPTSSSEDSANDDDCSTPKKKSRVETEDDWKDPSI